MFVFRQLITGLVVKARIIKAGLFSCSNSTLQDFVHLKAWGLPLTGQKQPALAAVDRLITAVNHHFWFQNCYICVCKRKDFFLLEQKLQ